MISPSNKIKVFISSACGKEKYNIVRSALKILIESTQLAEVYLFEEEEASTVTAAQHYTYALEDCDVCIFLIDNKDGVPDGVQVEVDCVRNHNIKALYYFCNCDSKEETPLQKSLIGAKNAKSKVIRSFEEFVQSGCQGLIDDLINIYKIYCKGRLIDFNEAQLQSKESHITDANICTPLLASKNDVIENADKCKKYLTNLILKQNSEVEKTDDFDDYCYSFLPMLFEKKSIRDFNMALFMKDLESRQTSAYHAVILKRWEAIQSYFLGDLTACVNFIQESLNMAKANRLPDWIIKDILIDLRNQNHLLDESQNKYTIESDAQKELNQSTDMVYYPLLDRFASNLYQKYMEDFLKNKIESPYTVTLGNNLMPFIESITSLYMISMFNGSLTHLLLIYERIEYLTLHLCEKYNNWNFKVLLLKMSIIRHQAKETDGLSNAFIDVLTKMSASDALDIYKFSDNLPMSFERQMSNLDAFKITGYFLSGEDFDKISRVIIDNIYNWLNNKDRCVDVGSHILDVLDGVAYRIPPNVLITICCKFFECNLGRWYGDLFSLIAKRIDINILPISLARRLINNIISLVNNKEIVPRINTMKQAIISIRKANKEITDELDNAIELNFPDFYEGMYRLETTENASMDMPRFLKMYIDEINVRNKTQGVDGKFFGYADRPHLIIRSIIMKSEVTFSNVLIDEAFKAGCNTLLSERQMLQDKSDSFELLIFLCKRYPELINRNSTLVQNLLSNKKIIENGSSMLSNFSETMLRFSALFLYDCFKEDIYLSLMNILSHLNNDQFSQIWAGKIILSVLEDDEQVQIEPRLEVFLLQCSLNWCNSQNLDVRWYAVKILFQLFRNPQNSDIICNQLVKSMEENNVYIKNLILRQSENLKTVDIATYQYILQKASVDSNYVVRKVYSEVTSTLRSSEPG